jgi:hypothetical protein
MYGLLWQKRKNRMPERGAKTFWVRARPAPCEDFFAAGAIRVEADLVARATEVRKKI